MDSYAPSSRFGSGQQSQYNAGLSYFTDPGQALVATPLGDITSLVAGGVGTVFGGPAGAAGAVTLTQLAGSLFGGTAVDNQRLARVNFFLQQAQQGNVAAAQLILGASPNVSGNERPMWQQAWAQLQQIAPGVAQQAQEAGPAWLTGSGDTATNYPAMKNYTAAWAAQHPFAAIAGAAGAAIGGLVAPGAPVGTPGYPGYPTTAHSGMSTTSQLVLLGLVGASVYALTRRGRR